MQFTLYVSSLKGESSSLSNCGEHFEQAMIAIENKAFRQWLLASMAVLKSDMTAAVCRSDRWRLLSPSPAGQVKPSNWDCSREAAFVDPQRPCHTTAECWWYKCYSGPGKMEQQGLSKGCLLHLSARVLPPSTGCTILVSEAQNFNKIMTRFYNGSKLSVWMLWRVSNVTNMFFFLSFLRYVLGSVSLSTDSSIRWVNLPRYYC